MQRPKGNDVRRATFEGPRELAPFFRNGRLETIPAARERRRALLAYLAERFASGRAYTETEVNRALQAVSHDHATLRRYLVDEGVMTRARSIYRRA
jgi:hypothetical protein